MACQVDGKKRDDMPSSSFETAHEAMLYEKAGDGTCDCFLCAHRCRGIQPGKRGICRVRENRDGALVSLVYGRLIAANADPIEKKPLYHFMPGTMSFSIATAGCNFRCDFCQNWRISQTDGSDIPGQLASPETVVEAAARHRCPSISYTYTEPTIFFEFAYDCAKLAQARGIRNCFVTNGYQSAETVERMAGLIDAANVDLKAFTDAFYRERCKARLQPVLDTIARMHAAGILVEVTTLLIPGYNDDPDELRRLAAFVAGVSPDVPWHVSRYHPDFEFDGAPMTPSETIFRALEIGKEAGLRYVYAGNMPAGKHEHTCCASCGATVIERSGFAARVVGLEGTSCKACGAELPIRI